MLHRRRIPTSIFIMGFTTVLILQLPITSSNLVITPAYSQTYDEWFATGWDSGCEDKINGSLNNTRGGNTPFTKGYNLGFAECLIGNEVNQTVGTTIPQDIGNMTSRDRLQNANTSTAESSKGPGYNIGCDDAAVTDPHERYLEQPGNGPDFQSDEFMTEYYKGFYICGGGTSYGGTLGKPDVPLEETTPSIPDEGSQGAPFTPQPPSFQGGGIDWITVCNNLQAALLSSCDILVNSDNTLTQEGQRAVDCIRNGIALAGGGSLLLSLPLPLITAALQALEQPTGCVGIVEWGAIGSIPDLEGIINLLT